MTKQHFISELTTLKELVQIPPHQTMLLHVNVYKMLKEITNHTGDVIEGVHKAFDQQMAKELMNNYYEKYEQERLEKENEAKSRMEENPKVVEAEVSTHPSLKYVMCISCGCKNSEKI